MTKLDHTNPLRIFCGNLCRKPFPIFHLPLLIIFLTFSIFHFPSPMYAQAYAPADPFYLLFLEKEQFNHADSLKISSTMIRPFFHNHKKGQFTVRYRQEQYSNDNTSNQENMDVRFIGKGRGWFQGVVAAWCVIAVSAGPGPGQTGFGQKISAETGQRSSPGAV